MDVAALGDRAESPPQAGGALAGRQPELVREMAARREAPNVADEGNVVLSETTSWWQQ